MKIDHKIAFAILSSLPEEVISNFLDNCPDGVKDSAVELVNELSKIDDKSERVWEQIAQCLVMTTEFGVLTFEKVLKPLLLKHCPKKMSVEFEFAMKVATHAAKDSVKIHLVDE